MRLSLNSNNLIFCLFESNQLFTLFILKKKKVQLQQNRTNYFSLDNVSGIALFYLHAHFISMPIRIRILTKQFLHILTSSRLDSALDQSFSLFQVKGREISALKTNLQIPKTSRCPQSHSHFIFWVLFFPQ